MNGRVRNAAGKTTKLTTTTEVFAGLLDGSKIGIGGMMLARRPVGLCVALAAGSARNLEVIALTASLETDVLIDAGVVGRLRTSMTSLGLFGFAPAWVAAVGSGTFDLVHETEMSIVLGLRATMAGLGFEPGIAWRGTDYRDLRPEIRSIRCPYTDVEYIAFPRIEVDVALIHATVADTRGNALLGGDLGIDRELARSATTTIVSTERVVTSDELAALGEPDIVGRDVQYVIEIPGGAAPTACDPLYEIDGPAFLHWAAHRTLLNT